VGCDWSTAEAVDQNGLIICLELGLQLGFHGKALAQSAAPHHARKTAAAELLA
jgi:hypothetical protein